MKKKVLVFSFLVLVFVVLFRTNNFALNQTKINDFCGEYKLEDKYVDYLFSTLPKDNQFGKLYSVRLGVYENGVSNLASVFWDDKSIPGYSSCYFLTVNYNIVKDKNDKFVFVPSGSAHVDMLMRSVSDGACFHEDSDINFGAQDVPSKVYLKKVNGNVYLVLKSDDELLSFRRY